MAKKKALITGGSRGIGRGIALVLAEAGYDIAITYKSSLDEARSLKDSVEKLGQACFYYQASLEEKQVAEEVTQQAITDLGGIDLLVCNAGITRYNSLLTVSGDDLDLLYNLNYRSYILAAKVAANFMVEQQVKGNIIFIASTRGIRAYAEDCIYGSLKAALIRATQSIALEMSHYGIRVNCLAPGATATRGNFTMAELSKGNFAKKIPLGRLGTPREVGHLVEYLASDKAAYITGDTIKIDGGLILPGMPEDSSPEAGYGWSKMRFRKG